jgi:hypothetical protein
MENRMTLEPNEFPDYFCGYTWDGKHALYGYPPDSHPNFHWIRSLEFRFAWLKGAIRAGRKVTGRYLIAEMIQWGGSQNGVLQKFEDGLGEVNLGELITSTVEVLDDHEQAIRVALEFPGMGLSYASKLLRFLDPAQYGALDSRIRAGLMQLTPPPLQRISDGNNESMVSGYLAFLEHVDKLKTSLAEGGIVRPECALNSGNQWRAADIEMALFRWAGSEIRTSSDT